MHLISIVYQPIFRLSRTTLEALQTTIAAGRERGFVGEIVLYWCYFAESGADAHCQVNNSSLAFGEIFTWLEQFKLVEHPLALAVNA